MVNTYTAYMYMYTHNNITCLQGSLWILKGVKILWISSPIRKVHLFHASNNQISSMTNLKLYVVGVEPTTFSDWEKIDAAEVREGERVGKPREKITSLHTMLDVIKQHQQDSTEI